MTVKFKGLTPLAWPKEVINAPTVNQLKWILPTFIGEENDLFSKDGSSIGVNAILFVYKELTFLLCNRTDIDKVPILVFLVRKEDCEPRKNGYFTVRPSMSIDSKFDNKLFDQILEACDLLLIYYIQES